jgi:transcriptional regulator with XRE-family HTH domain
MLGIQGMSVPHPKNSCGKEVRKLRTDAGLSQDALAAKAQLAGWDIGRGVIAKIETGTRYVNDLELVALCRLLSVEPTELLRFQALSKSHPKKRKSK